MNDQNFIFLFFKKNNMRKLIIVLIVLLVTFFISYINPNIFDDILRNSIINTVSIKELSLNSQEFVNTNISTQGFVDCGGFVCNGPPWYLYSEDLKYKIRIDGKIPPKKSDACGSLSIPLWRIRGKINLISLSDNSGTLSINDYQLVACRNIADIQRTTGLQQY